MKTEWGEAAALRKRGLSLEMEIFVRLLGHDPCANKLGNIVILPHVMLAALALLADKLKSHGQILTKITYILSRHGNVGKGI